MFGDSFRTEIEKEYYIELIALSGVFEMEFSILLNNSTDPVELNNIYKEISLNM